MNGENTFSTQLYLGNCDSGFNETTYGGPFSVHLEVEDSLYQNSDSDQTAFASFSLSSASCYSSQEPEFVQFAVGVEPRGTIPYNFTIEYALQLLTDEEYQDLHRSDIPYEEEQALLESIKPLYGSIDCNEASTVSECTSILY